MNVNPLLTKLTTFAEIGEDDARALDWLCSDIHDFPAKADLIQEGDRPEVVFLIVDGWAMRYKLLPDGRRHIMAYLIPGDLCDLHVYILKEMDHTIGLLNDATVVAIPKDKMLAVTDERPRLMRALWWSSLVDESILREWLVNLGQRSSIARIAHLFVELWWRMNMVGLANDTTIDLPLTQVDIADTMGLTPVHVNRVLQQMRSENLIRLSGRKLRILDMPRLVEISGFDKTYLHLERRQPAKA